MKNPSPNKLLLAAIATVIGISLPSAANATNAVTQWNDVALQAIRATLPNQNVVSRSVAILNTCIFDAWAAYDAKALGTQLGAALRRPSTEFIVANKQKAVSFAAYICLNDLFPTEIAHFNALMGTLGYDPNESTTDKTLPSGIGNAAAMAVLNFRHIDGSNQLGDLHPGAYSDYTGYKPVNPTDSIIDPNHWQPLVVQGVTQEFSGPFWGKVVPYALKSGSQFTSSIKPPVDYNTQPELYKLQAQQVLEYSANLTEEKKVIAEYWADGPHSELPPGHWVLNSLFVSSRDDHTLDQDAKMFFAVTNAVFDAGIAAWDAKRAFDYVRPITAIHIVFGGKQVKSWQGTIDGANWKPYQAANRVTPPFAEHVSGHSAFSAAGAETLKLFTKNDYYGNTETIKAGSSLVEPGKVPASDITLYWSTFSDAADDAALSRRYGGIHFVNGDIEGRKLGRLVGQQAWFKTLSYFNDPSMGGNHYEPDKKVLTIEDIVVNGQHFSATLTNTGNFQFTLTSSAPFNYAQAAATAKYDTSKGIVTIPTLLSAGKLYRVTLHAVTDTIFSLDTATLL